MSLFENGEPIFETENCIIREQGDGRVSIEVGDDAGTEVDKIALFYALRDSLEGAK